MGFLNKIKRIMQGFKKNKETDFISEDEPTEDEDQSTGAI
jgi:hypothetical protein